MFSFAHDMNKMLSITDMDYDHLILKWIMQCVPHIKQHGKQNMKSTSTCTEFDITMFNMTGAMKVHTNNI